MKRFARRCRGYKYLLVMLLPAVMYVLIFNYIPMTGLVLAFKKYNYAQGMFLSPWNGLANFKFLFISNKLWELTRNTLLYNAAFIVMDTVLEVMFAIIINELFGKWFKKIFQTFMFLPYLSLIHI